MYQILDITYENTSNESPRLRRSVFLQSGLGMAELKLNRTWSRLVLFLVHSRIPWLVSSLNVSSIIYDNRWLNLEVRFFSYKSYPQNKYIFELYKPTTERFQNYILVEFEFSKSHENSLWQSRVFSIKKINSQHCLLFENKIVEEIVSDQSFWIITKCILYTYFKNKLHSDTYWWSPIMASS